ncbi:hypothetical protein HLB23_35390 [Nocardia uniformis]|uniref:Mce-associated membrane protein n=1 Tax=Nocardia uniformis TaxID=53432 RepID=A0A849CB55_9NOCA|nr:hypothetical protein [Nocardia uniformis]NNH75076.1 hypothetical protein [Nocardia uniformis]
MSDNEINEPDAADDTVNLEKDASEADTAVAQPDSSRRRISLSLPGRTGMLAAAAAGVVVLGAAIGSSVHFYNQNASTQDILDAREDARLAACKYAPTLATYDSKNLDTWITGVMDGATGDWRTQFDSTSEDLKEVLAKGEVVSKATDVQCAIRNGDTTSAEAIVVIGQTITSLGTESKATPGQLSTVLRLEKSGDRWLVNKVESPLGLPQR